MGKADYVPFLLAMLVVLILHSRSASANFTLPFLSPLFDNACNEDVCGKGKCVDSNSSFGFECICEPGWKQARSQDDEFLKFLPCVIPNCSLNYNCAKAPAPAPDSNKKSNSSIFDPCFWNDCGGGSCNKTSIFTRSCECQEGYYNLFNSTAFPCFKECSLGGDCVNLGINISNNTASPNQRPSLADNSSSHAVNSKSTGAFGGFVVTFTTLAVVGWKYI